jgi:hypothetical protein
MLVDLNHDSGYVPGRNGPVVTLSDRVNGRIDVALVKARAQEPKRQYLGASILGDPCGRRVAYAYRSETSMPLDGRTLRIFQTGHVIEDLLAAWMKAAGFKLLTVDPATGQQFGFVDGPLGGHADGVIVSGPEFGLSYPVLWEAKGLNDRSWSNLMKNGLKISKPIYYGQVCIYMPYLGLAACLFTALNKNTNEIYHELVPADPAEAQRLVDLAVGIVQGRLPPRFSVEPTRYCDFCEFRDTCWSTL